MSDTATPIDVDTRPAVGARVKPAGTLPRPPLGTVTSRPDGVNYVTVRWDASGSSATGQPWTQQVPFAGRTLETVSSDVVGVIAAVAALDPEVWDEIGGRLTCFEAATLVAFFRASGLDRPADGLARAHAASDEDDDGRHLVVAS